MVSRRSHLAERTLELFNDSFARCRQGDLPGRFYERFLAVPGVRVYFVHTDFERQKRMLMGSLYIMTDVAARGDEGMRHLEHLATVHTKLGIPAEMYPVWLDALLETVAALDPKFSAEVAQAWRDVFLTGIEVMTRQAPVNDPSGVKKPSS